MSSGARDPVFRSVLGNLSRQPGVSTVERFRYHGARAALPIALALFVTFLFPPTEGTNVTRYDIGVVAPADVIAVQQRKRYPGPLMNARRSETPLLPT